jgi:hypothetical protein
MLMAPVKMIGTFGGKTGGRKTGGTVLNMEG